MEMKDHKKPASSEHEIHGVHLCHKCGWPFPNPHPSAKHRRAHKRVCGAIEGYKLTNSKSDHTNFSVSDNEHLSDDDRRTPSPKVDKGSIKEHGSSDGIGLKSCRSDDEFFSDAVTEFSDSGVSPILERHLESVKPLDKNVGKELLHDLEDTHVSKDEKTAVSDYRNGDSEIWKQREMVSSSVGTYIEEKGIEAKDIHSAAASKGPIKLDAVIHETAKETADRHMEPEFESKLTIVNSVTAHSAILDELVDQEKELTNNLSSKHDVSSQTEPPKFEHASVVSEVESDSSKNFACGNHGQSHEVCDLKEVGNEETQLLPVAETLPAVENPKAMIGEFKDHKVLKSSFSLDLGAAEEIRSVEDDKQATDLDNLPSVNSNVPARSVDNSSSYALENDLKEEDILAPTGGDIGTSVPENLPSACSSLPSKALDNCSMEALEVEVGLKKKGASTPIDGEVFPSIPENLPSALSSLPAGTVDSTSIKDLEDDSTPIDGEIGTCVPENLLRVSSVPVGALGNSTSDALVEHCKVDGLSKPVDGKVGTSVPGISSVPAGTVENSPSEALETDLKNNCVSTPIERQVGSSVPDNPPSAFSRVPAGTIDNSSSEALKDYRKKEGISTSIEGEVSSSVPVNPPSILRTSVPSGTVHNSSSEAFEHGLRKEGVSIPIDGDLPSSGFCITSDEETLLLPVAYTLPALENPEAIIGDFKDYKVLKSSFSLDPSAAEEISCVADDNKVTVHENLPSDTSNVPAATVDYSSSTLEGDLKKEGVSIPIEEEVGASGFSITGDIDTHLLPMAETLPAAETPKVMIGDFKGHTLLESSSPSVPGAAEEIRPVEDDTKVIAPENLLSAISNFPAGSVDNSSSDTLEDDHKMDGVPIPIGGEVDASGFSIVGNGDFGSSGSGDPPETSGFETNSSQPNNNLEGSRAPSLDAKSLQNEYSELYTREYSDRAPHESSADEQIWETTNLSGGKNADNHGIDELVHGSTVHGNVQAGDELSTNLTTSLTHEESIPETIEKCISLAGNDCLAEDSSMGLNSSSARNKTMGLAPEEKLMKHADPLHECTHLLTNSASLGEARCPNQVDIDMRASEAPSNSSVSPNCSVEIPNTFEGQTGDKTEVPRSSGYSAMGSQLKYEDPTVPSEKTSENASSKEIVAFSVDSEVPDKSSGCIEDVNLRDATVSGSFLDDGKDKVAKQDLGILAVDNSIASSSRTDSLDANWGSVSVLSTQSDLTAAEVLSSTDTQAAERIDCDSKKLQAAVVECHPDKSDAFEPPSFMTLVESRAEVHKKSDASEIQTAQRDEQTKCQALEAGWFPSLTNVVNESEGRKKNEAMIAKVTNWSTGKQHSPLKNLLSEAHAETKAKSPNMKKVPAVSQANETASKNNGTAVTTVSSILESEMPSADIVKKEIEKEWNSPARYPIQIKKEKRKGKPYWVPFVCCTSVHQDV